MITFVFIVVGTVLLLLYLLGHKLASGKWRGVAVFIGGVVGAGLSVGLVSLLALLWFITLVWRGGPDHAENREFTAAMAVLVTVFAAPAAGLMGLIGCLLGALRGAAWRPWVPPEPDGAWTAPTAAEVQRVVAGRVIADADSK